MKQSALEKKTYRREVAFGVAMVMGLSVISTALTSHPTVEEISRSVFEDVDVSRHTALVTQANELLTADPDLAADPGQWEKELKRLAIGVK